MTPEQAIIKILKEQINAYKALHDLLKEERICLVDINAEKIADISKEKDTVIMRLRLLEEERIRLLTKFSGDNEISKTINLNDLGKITGNRMFTVLRSRLLSLLQNIEEMNKFNSILIDRSINYIRTTANFINTFTDGNTSRTTGVLLSKET